MSSCQVNGQTEDCWFTQFSTGKLKQMWAQGKPVSWKTITQSRLQLMLVHCCQPEAVHTSAELPVLSKDTVGSEEIAFLSSHGSTWTEAPAWVSET